MYYAALSDRSYKALDPRSSHIANLSVLRMRVVAINLPRGVGVRPMTNPWGVFVDCEMLGGVRVTLLAHIQ